MSRLRVLYDVSVLGVAEQTDRAKTGVYRVVDRVARYLAGREDLDVGWTAYGDPSHLTTVRRMEAEGRLEGRPVVGPTVGPAGLRLAKRAADRACRTRFAWLGWRSKRVIHWAQLRQQLAGRHLRGADVLHSPFFPFPPASAGRRRPARVLTAYDLIPIKFPHLFDWGEQEKVRRGFEALTPRDWAVCISESTRNDLLEFRPDLDPDRVRVTPLAAAEQFRPAPDDDRAAAVRRRVGLPDGAPYFLSLCTLEPRKNLRHVVRAFAALRETTDADPYLVLVGSEGWQFEELLEDIAAVGRNAVGRGAGGRVIATGFLPDEDLPAVYSGAAAFVYMSLYEGFGLPPLEAMQCGTAVIVSDNSSLPEVVGEAGVLLPADDLDGLVEAMRRVLEDAGHRDRLAAAGLARAALFNWDRCGEQTVTAYRDAVAALG